MSTIGTALTETATKVLLCGAGELGKEMAIAFQRLGVEVVAIDRYENAPAMQVAHRCHVFNMLDGTELRRVIELEKPDYIVPEIEAIATDVLIEMEEKGYTVVPNARATSLTMNREGIRRLVSEELGIECSPYQFASNYFEYSRAVEKIGLPCVVKPIMSSSGHGQSVVRREVDIMRSWHIAQERGRAGAGKVIIEGFVEFDYEITLLTVRHIGGTTFLEPIGHRQLLGDYQESWQPQQMSKKTRKKAEEIAKKVTDSLGGYGIFGVELFIKGEDVIFSEVSPRPHDTGMVTMISQDLSEFDLHARAILGLPIPNIRFNGPSASKSIMLEGESKTITYRNLDKVLAGEDTRIRLFGKPSLKYQRRMGVLLARGATIEEALEKVKKMREDLEVDL